MALITIQEFADKHGVTKQAIEAAIRGERLKFTSKYGKRLIDSRSKYLPILGRGRKPSKTKTKWQK